MVLSKTDEKEFVCNPIDHLAEFSTNEPKDLSVRLKEKCLKETLDDCV